MEAFSAESLRVKDHTVCVFDNLMVDIQVWKLKEKVELYLMANNLYTGVLDDGEVDNKQLLPAKLLQCYAVPLVFLE